ncbi:hypothetical protein I3J09_18775 [Streptomyces clavuligerus]|nr:hypothetical protein [Streptomyces clavuligerus]ANW20066.1 hypothetical protein BB341_18530 [Streptomyces clavuligerus]AXU14690.1 hypothetical protein D1794_19350 [Streptomyces clavuligerus]EDY52469.1 hypothetical protein SSCG_05470 [Streptomyces clavuligerus]MBY6304713.1 hypothetical protein [Streptomyces clavuligerus]QCS07460.1 hypothetical protein CRV15_18705 [Streptomyces clavuligerus]
MAWTMATGAAVTLSWWGVHTVMSGTAYDRPRALPFNRDTDEDSDDAGEDRPEPQASSTMRPLPSPHRKPVRTDATGTSDGTGTGTGTGSSRVSGSASAAGGPTGKPTGPTPADGGQSPLASATAPASPEEGGPGAKAYTVEGGRVVFDMKERSAELAFATPNPGWRMQVWKQEWMIRVAFTKDGREESVFCSWHPDVAPTVEFYRR